jgi:hypothetical protein
VQHKNIFDRLTDTTLYTGMYKNRFDKDGRGVGSKEHIEEKKTPRSPHSSPSRYGRYT